MSLYVLLFLISIIINLELAEQYEKQTSLTERVHSTLLSDSMMHTLENHNLIGWKFLRNLIKWAAKSDNWGALLKVIDNRFRK